MSTRRNLVACLALFTVLGGTLYAAVGAAAAPAGDQPAAAPTAPSGCYPKGSTTIAQDKTGRFYSSVPPRSSGSREYWYVCPFKQGQPRKLPFSAIATRGPGPTLPADASAKVAGRYVAFFAYDAFFDRVEVFDMVTGRVTFSAVPFSWDHSGVGSLVVKPDGSVAWIATATSPSGPVVEVSRHDSTGTATVDSGPGIDPHSLAAGGSWLYWTDDGSPRSAPFH